MLFCKHYSVRSTPLWAGLRIRIRTGSGFNRVSGSGSGSRRAKITHKSNFFFKVHVFKCWMASWELKASSVTWTYFMKASVFYQKFFFPAVIFLHFWSLKPWIRIRIGIQPKMLDPDPDENKCGSATLFMRKGKDPDPYLWLRDPVRFVERNLYTLRPMSKMCTGTGNYHPMVSKYTSEKDPGSKNDNTPSIKSWKLTCLFSSL
jgi:hypothetical protein